MVYYQPKFVPDEELVLMRWIDEIHKHPINITYDSSLSSFIITHCKYVRLLDEGCAVGQNSAVLEKHANTSLQSGSTLQRDVVKDFVTTQLSRFFPYH